ncbi:MAG: Gfo/Idh/MocA family oxidoreductase [Bacteroidetes bacterium]|nr:Gfo/Idh/MocA family oxidoreductase [Bacteroidota bacterium]
MNIGLVGLGHLGKIHLKLLQEVDTFRITGIYDIDQKLTAELAEKYRVKAFQNYDDLLNASDAIDIVTPTITHNELASRAIRKGKHVFIEKPVTDNPDDARKLSALAKEAGVKIQVGHVERFNPAFLAARPYIQNPQFIEIHRLAPFNVRGTDVSVIFDLMIHDIDLTLSLVNSNLKHIMATGTPVVCDTPDIANARLEFENGCVANITVSRVAFHATRKLRIFQKDCYINIDLHNKTTEIARLGPVSGNKHNNMVIDRGDGTKKEIRIEHPIIQPVNAIKFELESFYESIQTNTTPVVSIQDAIQALEVSSKIEETIRTKAMIRF